MTTNPFDLESVHPSWKACLNEGLKKIDPDYLQHLNHSQEWLPGKNQLLNAFSLPINHINYVLFGESPYPRGESANGYAFWDASVKELWSEKGLSKRVNRATSLRNLIKMLLIADDLLDKKSVTQENISKLNKEHLVQTNEELFHNFLHRGFLLLNATLVLQETPRKKDAQAWRPFIEHVIINCLLKERPQVTLLLFGQIAAEILPLLGNRQISTLQIEHPYNISFISNKKVLSFFKPLHLLRKLS